MKDPAAPYVVLTALLPRYSPMKYLPNVNNALEVAARIPDAISEKEINQILMLAAGKTLTKANINTLNLRRLEAKLNKDKRIERADLYFDSKNRLNVRIIQKKPVMRVIDEAGLQYYLDEHGKQIPVTKGSASRVPIVTGIRDKFNARLLASDKPSKLKDIFNIMKYVSKDAFLSALIEQVHIENDSAGDIVLIPKIG